MNVYLLSLFKNQIDKCNLAVGNLFCFVFESGKRWTIKHVYYKSPNDRILIIFSLLVHKRTNVFRKTRFVIKLLSMPPN